MEYVQSVIKNTPCSISYKAGETIYLCPKPWDTFDYPLWLNFLTWTGAIFWATLFVIVTAVLLQLLWDLFGCIAFMLKVYNRVDNTPTIKECINFVLNRWYDGAESVRFLKAPGEVYKPWPWLSKVRRKQLENDTYIPG